MKKDTTGNYNANGTALDIPDETMVMVKLRNRLEWLMFRLGQYGFDVCVRYDTLRDEKNFTIQVGAFPRIDTNDPVGYLLELLQKKEGGDVMEMERILEMERDKFRLENKKLKSENERLREERSEHKATIKEMHNVINRHLLDRVEALIPIDHEKMALELSHLVTAQVERENERYVKALESEDD